MRTFAPKKDEIEKKWWVINAEGKTLGRLATEVAVLLRGKRKPEFAHFVDCGDFVVIINAEKINVTGKKLEQKKYYSHSGYPGGLKVKTLKELLDTKPEEVVRKAVWGMIPKGKLGRAVYKKLKVYRGSHHPHEAQKPQEHQF
ncbi:MAG: 50S ribosomal protein L13 [Candidatus Aminicenantes bacterium]|jgi:large subunit ribosomal protein L13|nr:50S ribosomal protein L13 [Candidatus Aminicenantes bacterium]